MTGSFVWGVFNMAQRSDPRDSNGFGIIYLSDAARLALQSRTMEEYVGREQEGGIVVCGDLSVWVKQKDATQTKQTASKRCVFMLVSLLPLLFSLSCDKLGLKASKTASWSCQDCSYGPWHPPVSLHFSDFTADDCCMASPKMLLDKMAHLPSHPHYSGHNISAY